MVRLTQNGWNLFHFTERRHTDGIYIQKLKRRYLHLAQQNIYNIDRQGAHPVLLLQGAERWCLGCCPRGLPGQRDKERSSSIKESLVTGLIQQTPGVTDPRRFLI